MRFVVALAIVLGAARAAAHVAPAASDNNRYLKLTALGDRLRLAYTVFYGEAPGAALRRTLDTNHDGAIDATERDTFGARVAREVAAALDLVIDGAHQPVTWSLVDVGLGTTDAAPAQGIAGAFSIDLVGWFCLSMPRGRHDVRLRDRFPLERPGETEIKVEASPGVAIGMTRIGGARDEDHEYTLVGPRGTLETDGLELAFTVSDPARTPGDAMCRRPAPPAREWPPWVILSAAGVALLAAAVLVWQRSRRRA